MKSRKNQVPAQPPPRRSYHPATFRWAYDDLDSPCLPWDEPEEVFPEMGDFWIEPEDREV